MDISALPKINLRMREAGSLPKAKMEEMKFPAAGADPLAVEEMTLTTKELGLLPVEGMILPVKEVYHLVEEMILTMKEMNRLAEVGILKVCKAVIGMRMDVL